MKCAHLILYNDTSFCYRLDMDCNGCGCSTDGINEDNIECVFFKPYAPTDKEQPSIANKDSNTGSNGATPSEYATKLSAHKWKQSAPYDKRDLRSYLSLF